MAEPLAESYAKNLRFARRKKLFSSSCQSMCCTNFMKRKIPVYSGLKGTGKTSYVRAFADSKNFEFYRLNCIHADAELFNEALFSAQSQIVKGKIKGAVFLLSNIYKADKEWKKSFVRYSNNYFVINFKGSLKMIEISDSIFVVGENTVQPLQSIKDKIS